jgi:uncharacterized membrane protein YfcA
VTLVFLAIGLVAGICSGVFGIGGGIVIVPLLVFFAKMPQKLANGTSLGVFLLPVALLGALSYWKAGNVNVRASLLIASGLFVGSFLGAQLSLSMGDAVLKRGFAVLLVAVAARLWLTAA